MVMKNVLSFIIISLMPISALAIVNMDSLHFADKVERFSVDADITFSGSTGNSLNSKISFNNQLTWVNKRSINLVVLGHHYGESNQERSLNKSFIHYRNIQKISAQMGWEIFSQLEKNEFTRLSYRGLVGAGLRFSVFKSDNHHTYLGVGGFSSREETEFTAGLSDHGIEEFTRANIYLFSKLRFSEKVTFSNSLYYQPRLSNAADFRALLESKLDFKVSKNLSFRLSFALEHDNKPPQTIKSSDVQYKSGLKYHF